MAVTVKDNRAFFDGIYQEVWRKMIPPQLTPAEVDFIEDVCGLQKGRPVLDLMCGYGRHAMELARRGYPVTAIDSSEGYIGEVQEQAAAASLPITARVGDVAHLQLDSTFGAAICMGNSFSFFDEASLQQLLQQLAPALLPGNCFVINTWMIAEIIFRHFKEREWHQVAEYKYLIESRYLTQPSRVEAEHTILLPDGGTECLKGVDYIYSLAELEQLLELRGFGIQDVFYTPRKRKFQLGDNKAYIVAVRK
jgi:SAM-dependent methyltransferase